MIREITEESFASRTGDVGHGLALTLGIPFVRHATMEYLRWKITYFLDGMPALLPCAQRPRQARETPRGQFTNLLYLLYCTLVDQGVCLIFAIKRGLDSKGI